MTLFLLPAAKQAVQILSVLEIVVQDGWRIRVIDDVVLEVRFGFQDVSNDAAQKSDIRTRTDRHVNIGDCAGTREARIHVNNGCAALARLHDPAKRDWMALGHIRTFDDDDIRIHQVSRECRRAASSKRGPQTGDRGGMSNTGLIFDLNDA